jgi:phage terminase large subunit|tara:strand:- start:643 stop:1956 length:1314 start_codon:yes stop_codon:yes gene_type:complete
MSEEVDIELPPKLVPIFEGEARYRASFGGRGGAKSRAFAMMTAVWGYKFGMSGKTGQILCLRQYMNSLSESSFAEIKSAIQAVPFLNDYYDCGDHYIRSKDGRINYSFAGLTRNIDSIKSKARIILAFIDEAETVSEEAYMKLLPSIREENSECWVIWNPQSKDSATHKRFRLNTPDSCKITAINWQDNPWMPKVLTEQRLEDLEQRPDTYGHVWNGDFLEFPEGAFWLREINKAQADGRISKLPVVESHPCMAFFDIGASDGCAVWVCQQVGLEFRLIDFYEAWSEPYSHAVKWLKSLDLVFEDMYLPHDADHKRQGQVSNKSPKQMLKELMPSSNWRIVPRIQDILWGIQQTSDVFPYLYIDEVKCAKGLDHLKAYRRKWSNSEQRWSHIPDKSEGHSEAADALRQLAQAFAAGDLGRTKKKHRGALKRNVKGLA